MKKKLCNTFIVCIIVIIFLFLLTGCAKSSDIDNPPVEKHVCNTSFSSLIIHEQYIEGTVTSFKDIPNELFLGTDCLVTIKSPDEKNYSFIIPEAGGWPLGFQRYFYGYYEGQTLRIYYDGTYSDTDINSAIVKAVTDGTEWSIQCVSTFQEDLISIYNSSGEVKICCSEMAIKSIIEYLGLTGFEKNSLNNVLYYINGDSTIYCSDIDIIDNTIFYIVNIVNKDNTSIYLVDQKSGEISFVA